VSVVGLIPARGGSKGLPGKNIKPLDGKALICWTIDAAIESKRLDRVIVSTDCREIAAVSASAGAEVPFIRPAELACDHTPDRPVMLHVLDWLSKNEGLDVSLIVYLRPTTPFKTGRIIDDGIAMLQENERCSALRSITRVEGVHHPYWMHRVENGLLAPFVDGIDDACYLGRQSLPPCYRVNGVVDILRPAVIAGGRNIYGSSICTMELDEATALDIDTPLDFSFCEFMARQIRGPIKNEDGTSGIRTK
jgi:CMP-N-acetylneuraminic acid synthetase